ncbi:hypothetical protein F5X68DRAFT_238016 [Plectosphaerella plurivora]|uniref:Uncharacterized protein n=1 Tax=Plectosphaerella plurivora TaxID=936078 RepID=A0A9P8ZZL7_9PEZI|nr:hypothetical protein F5X68DRAFT_238016 [Plectosphaerella plurivora]
MIVFLGSLFILSDRRRAPPLGPVGISQHFYSNSAGDARLDSHPVSTLIRDARAYFKKLLEDYTTTLEQTFAAARKSNTIIIEEFFDRIYYDLNPL